MLTQSNPKTNPALLEGVPKTRVAPTSHLKDFLDLTKPRLVPLVLLSTAVGFFLASAGKIDYWKLFLTLAGTWCTASGSMTLNQWMEKDRDSKMQRTMNRPLPAGRLQPAEALIFGSAISATGFFILYAAVSPAACLIAAITSICYLGIYTPLKPITPFCTLIGAVPGALPPVIGCVAAEGRLSPLAWVLFAIIFVWQMPHFFAISWLYREDFAAAGFRLLATLDPDGKQVARQMLSFSVVLLPASLLPTWIGATGKAYLLFALVLGSALMILSAACFRNMEQGSRALFRASIFYLASIFLLMILDKA